MRQFYSRANTFSGLFRIAIAVKPYLLLPQSAMETLNALNELRIPEGDTSVSYTQPPTRCLEGCEFLARKCGTIQEFGMLQPEFDRRELNKLATEAKQAFGSVKRDKRRWSYVYSPDADYTGLMEGSLPTFWINKLSRILPLVEDRLQRFHPRVCP